jgi:hypothetical protein
MHLQSTDRLHDFKVWLEDKGKRVCLPEGAIPRKVMKPLLEEVKKHRRFIEDNWVRLMLDQGWLDLHVALPHVTLVTYPQTPNKFVRTIDLRTWLTKEQLASLRPEIISLNHELAALRLWSDRAEEQGPYDVRLSTLLWVD